MYYSYKKLPEFSLTKVPYAPLAPSVMLVGFIELKLPLNPFGTPAPSALSCTLRFHPCKENPNSDHHRKRGTFLPRKYY